MSAAAIVVSLILAIGSLVLVWRGVSHLPRAQMVRYALIWGAIILGLVLVLRLAGV